MKWVATGKCTKDDNNKSVMPGLTTTPNYMQI